MTASREVDPSMSEILWVCDELESRLSAKMGSWLSVDEDAEFLVITVGLIPR